LISRNLKIRGMEKENRVIDNAIDIKVKLGKWRPISVSSRAPSSICADPKWSN